MHSRRVATLDASAYFTASLFLALEDILASELVENIHTFLLLRPPRPTNLSDSLGCCHRSSNGALMWEGAACTSTSHYGGVRAWVVGFLANNRNDNTCLFFRRCEMHWGGCGNGWNKKEVRMVTQRSTPLGTGFCAWQPAVGGELPPPNSPVPFFLSQWNCFSDIETL